MGWIKESFVCPQNQRKHGSEYLTPENEINGILAILMGLRMDLRNLHEKIKKNLDPKKPQSKKKNG